MIISPLKVWVQNILPVVYDDSLSYLEIVAKINAKTNEIISQTNENTHAIETLASTIAELGDIDELRALLDEIQDIVDDLYTTAVPMMDGTASAGSAEHAARSDHVHPSDTSKAPVNHASNETTYGVGNGNNYGHVKITDDINNTDAGTGIKPSVVKNVNNRLSTFTKNNLLDNWYFVYGKAINGDYSNDRTFPVNQRGQQSYSTTDAYSIDRWKLTSGSVSIEQYGITLNGTIVQILENAIDQAVVASALLSDGTMITPTYNDSTKTLTLAASNKTIIAVKLELGTEQTLAHQENGIWVLNEIPDFRTELAKCQEKQIVLSGTNQTVLGTIFASTSTYVTLGIPLPTTMHGTAKIEETTSCYITTNGGWSIPFSIPAQTSVRLSANMASFDIAPATPIGYGTFPSNGLIWSDGNTKIIISTE